MAKIKIEKPQVETQYLYNESAKYKFIIAIGERNTMTIIRKNVSDFHVGTFKYKKIEDITENKNFRQYFLGLDIPSFILAFKYE